MVSEKEVKGEKIFICGLGYRERETARSCEDYCERNKSCSIEITKDAVYFPEPDVENIG
jgi:hypothetical protein